MNNPETLVNKR